MTIIVTAFESCIFGDLVHPLNLLIIRHDGWGALCVHLLSSEAVIW